MADKLYAADLAYSTLDGAIDDAVVTLTVDSAAGFPGSTEVPFLIGIDSEIIKVGAVNTGTGVMSTLTRGYAGTAAAAHLDGATVSCKVFAEYLNNAYDLIDTKAATIHNLVDTTNHPVTGLTTGHVLTASGATAYSFAVPVHGYKNKIINGNFDIWQRGTSLAVGTGGYLADRWNNVAAGATIAPAQQTFTVGQTDVPGEPTYFHRAVVVAGSAVGDRAFTEQYIESVRSCAGQTVTVSFYAKADANKNMSIDFHQGFGSGGSPSAGVGAIGVEKFALTTSWQKFTKTVAIPSITGKTLGTTYDGDLGIVFWFDAGSDYNARTDSLGHQAGTFDIAQVQIELGSVATAFEQRPIGLEYQLCCRYYWRGGAAGDAYKYGAATGIGYDFAISNLLVPPANMRIRPTVSIVTTPTYVNCTDADLSRGIDLGSGFYQFAHRVAVTTTGWYRVTNAVYDADAEF